MNPSTLNRLRAEWAPSIPRELLAGAVATFALIPEVIAFSFVAGGGPSGWGLIPELSAFPLGAGVGLSVGLFASFVISRVIASTGGRPAMVSGKSPTEGS